MTPDCSICLTSWGPGGRRGGGDDTVRPIRLHPRQRGVCEDGGEKRRVSAGGLEGKEVLIRAEL